MHISGKLRLLFKVFGKTIKKYLYILKLTNFRNILHAFLTTEYIYQQYTTIYCMINYQIIIKTLYYIVGIMKKTKTLNYCLKLD